MKKNETYEKLREQIQEFTEKKRSDICLINESINKYLHQEEQALAQMKNAEDKYEAEAYTKHQHEYEIASKSVEMFRKKLADYKEKKSFSIDEMEAVRKEVFAAQDEALSEAAAKVFKLIDQAEKIIDEAVEYCSEGNEVLRAWHLKVQPFYRTTKTKAGIIPHEKDIPYNKNSWTFSNYKKYGLHDGAYYTLIDKWGKENVSSEK